MSSPEEKARVAGVATGVGMAPFESWRFSRPVELRSWRRDAQQEQRASKAVAGECPEKIPCTEQGLGSPGMVQPRTWSQVIVCE